MSQEFPPPYGFRTARASRPVFCHQEFLDKLSARRNEAVGKRASLLLQHMAVDIARLHYKATSGVNRGWRRSRLGGGSGFHFYAWWAPAGAVPFKGESSFGEALPESVFLRDIRHHDDHALLGPGHLSNDYLSLNVSDLRGSEYAPEPWTNPQVKFARSRAVARILKGHPGSGKTTALLHAADSSQAERVLYLTFSKDLAALARDYFDRFCSDSRSFVVLTFPEFLRQLLDSRDGLDEIDRTPDVVRGQFRRDVGNFKRLLGPWSTELDALYDEMHAHVVGAAMPEQAGRFPKAERLHLPEKVYQGQRLRYLGLAACTGVEEAVRRLEKSAPGPLADRYFPELAVAWRAAQAVVKGSGAGLAPFLKFNCIAVDEVQDLTPLESFVVVKLASLLNEGSKPAPLLLAGDEAQTVRPTDFEWAWLNDILHSMLSAPQEFKMSVNLRSPRRIADLVNRTWTLYDYLTKQDRPSGTGYAEIDDDSPDQVLYAAAHPSELPQLIEELSQREGLALIAFNPATVPEAMRAFVLSPAEAKGLDFHSVCVLSGGPLLERIVDEESVGPMAALGKRLAIDELRVVLSRPTERLLWIDIAPVPSMVREVSMLLRSPMELHLSPMSVEALRTALDEEELEVEERIQRCQRDALQLVPVKPDLAWSRAHQAVGLLGLPGAVGAVLDVEARKLAHMTLAQVCFQLAFRKKSLSPELGSPDLYGQAADAVRTCGKTLFGIAMRAVGAVQPVEGPEHLNRVAALVQAVSKARAELPSWFIVEISPRAAYWLEALDRTFETGDNPLVAHQILPGFFDALGLPDAQERKAQLAQRAVQILMKNKRYLQALVLLEELPEARPKLAAECYEETEQFAKAAAIYLELGEREKALRCYRAVPDFEAALGLARQIEGSAARPSLEWLAELDRLLAKRPDNFNRVMTAPEKKLLEGMLERGLGVQKKKAAAKKAVKKAVKKAATQASKKKAVKKTPKKRLPEFY